MLLFLGIDAYHICCCKPDETWHVCMATLEDGGSMFKQHDWLYT